MEKLVLLLIAIALIEWIFRPRLDYLVDTRHNEGWVVLWYGRKWRNYIRLWRYIPKG